MKEIFGTSFVDWESRQEFGSSTDYFQFGRYAVEVTDLETIWERRAIKKIAVENGAFDDVKSSFDSANNDKYFGKNTDTYLEVKNSKGSDTFVFGDKTDILISGNANDWVDLGDGFFNFARTEGGDDTVFGGAGMDFTSLGPGDDRFFAGDGSDHSYLGSGNDVAYGGAGDEWLGGEKGNDILYGGDGNDWLVGAEGDDVLYAGAGEDLLEGGDGNDRLVFVSDAGTPSSRIGEGIDFHQDGAWKDKAIGGAGNDTFHYIYEMDATPEIIAKHTAADGTIDWRAIMRENENFHDHWVNWGGIDFIEDFEKGKDKIVLEGHTVAYKIYYVDDDLDGENDSSHIVVYSDQKLMVAGVMGVDVSELPEDLKLAHDEDVLGVIIVDDAIVTNDDISLLTDTAASVREIDFDADMSVTDYVNDFEQFVT